MSGDSASSMTMAQHFRFKVGHGALFAGAAVAAAAVYLIITWKFDPFCCAQFDRQTWAHGAKSESCLRGAMVHPLMRDKVVVGTQLKDVVELLGPPDVQIAHAPGCVGYELGLCARPGYWRFRVCYDDAERVRSAEITP